MQSNSVENIFARAWTLLASNPVIVVPGVVVGVVTGLIQGSLAPHPMVVDASGDAAATLARASGRIAATVISVIVSTLAYLITQTYTTGMAGAAWRSGRTTLADGQASFREDAGRLLAAVLLLAVLVLVVGALTFGLGDLLVFFFAMYLIPAVVLDNLGAFPALRLSARIATKRALSTIIIIVLLIVIAVVVTLLVTPLVFIPFLGPLLAAVVGQAITSYTALVIAGEYLSARSAPDVIAAGPPL